MIKTKVCCKCHIEKPIKDFMNGSAKCISCIGEERVSRASSDGVKRPRKKKTYKLTALDKIAIKCTELGISYGEYQQRERQGRL